MSKLVILAFALVVALVSGNSTTRFKSVKELTSTPVSIKTTTIPTRNSKCLAIQEELDSRFNEIFFFLKPNHYGFNDSTDMTDNYCVKVPEWVKDIQDYRRCFRLFPRTLFNIVITNLKKVYKKFCLDSQSMKLALKHLECLDKETSPSFLDVGDKITSLLRHVANMSDPNQVIPGLCCGVNHWLLQCKDEWEKICKSKARPDTPEFYMDFVKSLFSDVLDIMCGKLSSATECQSIDEGVLQSLENRKREKFSVIWSILQIFQKLDGEVNL